MEPGGWVQRLKDGRIELRCKGGGVTLHITAPEAQAWEAVEWFERSTGLYVASEVRPVRTDAPLPGQLSLVESV